MPTKWSELWIIMNHIVIHVYNKMIAKDTMIRGILNTAYKEGKKSSSMDPKNLYSN